MKARVVKVWAEVGPWGSAAIICELDVNGETKYFIPWIDSAATDMCCRDCKWPDDADDIISSYVHWTGETDEEIIREDFEDIGCPCLACQIERDPDAWLDAMYGAIDLPREGEEIVIKGENLRFVYDEIPMF